MRAFLRNIYSLNDIVAFVFLFYITACQLQILYEHYIAHLVVVLLVLLLLSALMIRRGKGYGSYSQLFAPLVAVGLLLGEDRDLLVDGYRVCYFILLLSAPLLFQIINKSRLNLLGYSLWFYFVVSVAVNVDVVSWMLTGHVLFFEYMFYVSPRFYGPFFDPNFLGFVYGVIFIAELYTKRRTLFLFSFFICIVASGSWAGILILTISFLFSAIYRIRHILIKPLTCILLSFCFGLLFFNASHLLEKTFMWVFAPIFWGDDAQLYSKYISLLNRFESVSIAVDHIFRNPFGYGPRSLLDFLPRDPHNSFVGITFEYGLLALLCILPCYSVRNRNRDGLMDVSSSFTCLSAVLLNVIYMPIFLLTIYLLFRNEHRNKP